MRTKQPSPSDFDKLPKSMAEARSIGAKWYFTGKPCPKGHISARYVFKGDCMICRSLKIKIWRQNNKARLRELGRNRYHRLKDSGIFRTKIKKFHEKNPLYRKEYNSKNKANFAVYHKRYAERHPEKLSIKYKIQSMRKRLAEGSFTEDDIKYILKLQKNKCAYCRKKLNKAYDVDHIIALASGGTHHRSNLQITCPTCNRSKGKKHPIDFAKSMGLLI